VFEGSNELEELVVFGKRAVEDVEVMNVVLKFGYVCIEGHDGGFPLELVDHNAELNGFVSRRETGEEMVAEVVPASHVVGECVCLDTRWSVDVSTFPVRPNGGHDLGLVPVCSDAVGCEERRDGGDHAMASLLVVMHIVIGHGDELDVGGPFVAAVWWNVVEKVLRVLLELVGDDVTIEFLRGIVVPM
jgi:hypothetical protein